MRGGASEWLETVGSWLSAFSASALPVSALPAATVTASSGDQSNIVKIALCLAVALSMVAVFRMGQNNRGWAIARGLANWVLITAALAAGFNYRDDLMALGARVAAEISDPGSLLHADTQTDGERSVRIRRRHDGHFIARTLFNGQPLSMLVDTGASMVVLRPADAQKLGINVNKLRYSVPVQTANGTTYAAPIHLKTVAVGQIRIDEVDALVAKPGTLRDSLLGMSFLNRLRSYEFSGEFLTFRI